MAEVRLCQIQVAGLRCLEVPEAFYDAGCEHEHVTTDIGICAVHVERVTADPWECSVCRKADGHKCPVLIRAVARG
jgi:hypothetical protein